MNERYIATVDLGTSKMALTVARVNGSSTEVLYYDREPSEGIVYGSVRVPMRAARALRRALDKAENELGIKISQIVTGMPRCFVRQESTPGQILREDSSSCITREELENMKSMALDSYPLEDDLKEQIYGAVAQSFATDDFIGAEEDDVIGVPSEILKGNFKVFVGPKKAVSNIDTMVNYANVAIARKYFLPAATGEAVLTKDELENGVGLIEFGCGVTSLSIFKKNILRYHASIPFGGRSITEDIKYEGSFNTDLAENIKFAFGACQPDKLQNFSEKVIQIVNEEDGSFQNLSVKYLSEIITARVHEIMQSVYFLIQKSGYADKLRAGLVVTGGCANLTNILNLIRDESGYTVRMGFPRVRQFAVGECYRMLDPADAASVALLRLAKEDQWLNCVDESGAPAAQKSAAAEVTQSASAPAEPASAKQVESAVSPKQEAASVEKSAEIFSEPAPVKTVKGREISEKNAFAAWEFLYGTAGTENAQISPRKEEQVKVEALQPPVPEPDEKKKKKKKKEEDGDKQEDPDIKWGSKAVEKFEGIFDFLLGSQYDKLK